MLIYQNNEILWEDAKTITKVVFKFGGEVLKLPFDYGTGFDIKIAISDCYIQDISFILHIIKNNLITEYSCSTTILASVLCFPLN